MKKAVRSRGNGFVSIYSPWHDRTKRWLSHFHHPYLNRRGMRTYSDIITGLFIDEKGILHISRGVLRRKIKSREVMPIILDFRPFGNDKTKLLKDFYNFL